MIDNFGNEIIVDSKPNSIETKKRTKIFRCGRRTDENVTRSFIFISFFGIAVTNGVQ